MKEGKIIPSSANSRHWLQLPEGVKYVDPTVFEQVLALYASTPHVDENCDDPDQVLEENDRAEQFRNTLKTGMLTNWAVVLEVSGVDELYLEVVTDGGPKLPTLGLLEMAKQILLAVDD